MLIIKSIFKYVRVLFFVVSFVFIVNLCLKAEPVSAYSVSQSIDTAMATSSALAGTWPCPTYCTNLGNITGYADNNYAGINLGNGATKFPVASNVNFSRLNIPVNAHVDSVVYSFHVKSFYSHGTNYAKLNLGGFTSSLSLGRNSSSAYVTWNVDSSVVNQSYLTVNNLNATSSNNYGVTVQYDNGQGEDGYIEVDSVTRTIFYTLDSNYVGCTDYLANNYDSSAQIDNQSCTYTTIIYGCRDISAINYNSYATVADNSCIFASGQISTSTTNNAVIVSMNYTGFLYYSTTTPYTVYPVPLSTSNSVISGQYFIPASTTKNYVSLSLSFFDRTTWGLSELIYDITGVAKSTYLSYNFSDFANNLVSGRAYSPRIFLIATDGTKVEKVGSDFWNLVQENSQYYYNSTSTSWQSYNPSAPNSVCIDSTINDLSSCNPFTLDLGTCFARLIVPSASSTVACIQVMRNDVMARMPFVGDFFTTATSAIPVIRAKVPNGVVGAGAEIVLDSNHAIDWILNATTSTFNNSSASSTKTFYEITSVYWNNIVYILLALYILSRIFSSRAFEHLSG